MRKSTDIHFTITNTLSLLVLSTITLATNPISYKPHRRLLAQLPPSSLFPDASIHIAAAIEPCRPGELACNDGCMPPRAECCPDGDGYCKQGYACVADGCCPFGKTCDGRIVCDFGEVPCGDTHCMPEGAVCCPGGSYCRAGETCFQNGFEGHCEHGGSTTAEETKTSSVANATSSHDQTTTEESTSTRTSHEEPTSASTSTPTPTSLKTSSSEHESSKPAVPPTFRLPAASSTLPSIEAPSATLSSGPGQITSPSKDNAATMKIPVLELTLALALVLIVAGGL